MYSDKLADDKPANEEVLGFTGRFSLLLLAYAAVAILFGSIYALVVTLLARPAGTILTIITIIGACGSDVVLRRALDRSFFHNARRS